MLTLVSQYWWGGGCDPFRSQVAGSVAFKLHDFKICLNWTVWTLCVKSVGGKYLYMVECHMNIPWNPPVNVGHAWFHSVLSPSWILNAFLTLNLGFLSKVLRQWRVYELLWQWRVCERNRHMGCVSTVLQNPSSSLHEGQLVFLVLFREHLLSSVYWFLCARCHVSSLAYKGLCFQRDSFSSRVTQRPMCRTLVIDLFQTFLSHTAINSSRIEDFHKTKMVDIEKSSDKNF